MASTKEKDSQINAQTKGIEKKIYDPNDFRIELVKEEDYEMYVQFIMDYLFPREQLSLGVGLPANEFRKPFSKLIKSWMSSGASVCATYVPTNELAGVMFTQVLTRNTRGVYTIEDEEQYSEGIQNFLKVLGHLEWSVDLFEDPTVDKILEIAATTVQPKFAGNNLTYRITEESERLAAEMGCQIIMSQSTNKITQHIRSKMGFEVWYELDYANFEVDGKKVIDVSNMNGTTVAKVMKKYLKKQ